MEVRTTKSPSEIHYGLYHLYYSQRKKEIIKSRALSAMDRDECAKDLSEVLHSLFFEQKAPGLISTELKGSKDRS